MKAGVVSPAIPTASSSPLGPGLKVVVLTERISGFYRRTICADGGVARGDYMPVTSHCRPCCQDKNHCKTENSGFHNALLQNVVCRLRRVHWCLLSLSGYQPASTSANASALCSDTKPRTPHCETHFMLCIARGSDLICRTRPSSCSKSLGQEGSMRFVLLVGCLSLGAWAALLTVRLRDLDRKFAGFPAIDGLRGSSSRTVKRRS